MKPGHFLLAVWAALRFVPTATLAGESDAGHWAFQPVSKPAVPAVTGRDSSIDGHPIDRLVAARQAEHGLTFRQEASPRELVRRLFFDLIGLPPTPAETDRFAADPSPAAYARLIDELLARPQYGERWARHWLDLVRYAQTNGYERDDEKPFAWRYRDYVIQAFNEDKPFDVFVREQIAGDELDEVTDASLVATGLYRLGVWDDEPDDARMAEFDGLDDVLSTIGTCFLGITIGCARCHEHKFDPIRQADYYRMLAFIRNVHPYEKPGENSKIFAELPSGAGQALAVSERGRAAPATHILLRGDAGQPDAEVFPDFPGSLQGSSRTRIEEIAPVADDAPTSGRRRVLADWIASAENPLTARVLVNRLWQHHFGRGIVPTPSNFGRAGLPPANPPLLDYLAAEFVESGWSIKQMHRLMLTSRTYRQSSAMGQGTSAAAAHTIDPDNAFCWRQTLRRLEAETIRDSILMVSGRLNLESGGAGFFPELPPEIIAGQSMPGRGWGRSSPTESARRSIYIFSKRGIAVPMLELFDVASSEQPVATRSSTVVAPQALTMLNGPFLQRSSRDFASRLLSSGDSDSTTLVQTAYGWALGRSATPAELAAHLAYLERQREAFAAIPPALLFAPALPSAIHNSLYERTRGPDCLSGPDDGWEFLRGTWPDRGDGIRWVDFDQSPCALWPAAPSNRSSVRCRLVLDPNADVCGLILCGRRQEKQPDLLCGYELRIYAPEQQVRLLRHLESSSPTIVATATIAGLNRMHGLEITATLDDGKLAISFPGTDVRLQVADEQPLEGTGYVGVRTWGAELRVQRLTVHTSETSAEHDAVTATTDDTPADTKAWAQFCNLVLNLNEFIYID